MIGLGDVGFFRKKNESINNKGDFKDTLGNCKHYGAKLVDCLGIAAGIVFITPLIISVFSRDNSDEDSETRNGNNRNRRRR